MVKKGLGRLTGLGRDAMPQAAASGGASLLPATDGGCL